MQTVAVIFKIGGVSHIITKLSTLFIHQSTSKIQLISTFITIILAKDASLCY